MYYYILEGGSYEESFKDIYCSETLYTQEEFENIVISAYKYYFEEIEFKKGNFHRCGLSFDPAYICWESEFISWIEENTDLKVIDKAVASMDIGTSITPNENTKKLKRGIDFTKMPHCRDNCIDDDKYDCTYPDLRFGPELAPSGENL